MSVKKKLFKLTYILYLFLVIITLYRIHLAVSIPLYADASANLDDFMMVKYAIKMINFEWLGTFNYLTLAKSTSYSLFLAIGYFLHIPYSMFLILCYISSIVLLILALKKIINNKVVLTILYTILLYSPAMFHVENTIKIYRGGLIITFALFVIACVIGLFSNRDEKLKKMLLWSIGLSLSLSFFWFIKEDSIWILPFVLGISIATIIWLLINKRKMSDYIKRILIILIPFVSLIFVNVLFKSLNYVCYGEYTITDRTGTYYKSFLHDLLSIKSKRIDGIWITKDTMYKAIDASKTLKKIKPQIDLMYDSSWALVKGEIKGDIIFWTIRGAMNDAGVYKDGGKKANEFYKKIHKELTKAFDDGKLKRENAFYISDVTKGITKGDIKYFKKELPKEFKVLIDYSENEIGTYNAKGQYADIVLMDYVTNSKIVWPQVAGNELYNQMYNNALSSVKKANKIVSIYQKSGKIIFITSIIGIVILVIKTIIDLFKKKYTYLPVSIIIIGLVLTIFVVVIGISWFVSWFEYIKYRYMYNYSCGIIPLIQIIKVFGNYYLLYFIYKIIGTMISIFKKRKNNIVIK